MFSHFVKFWRLFTPLGLFILFVVLFIIFLLTTMTIYGRSF